MEYNAQFKTEMKCACTYVVPYKKCESIVGKCMDGRASRRDNLRRISHRTCRRKLEFIASDFLSRDPSRDILRSGM
jgi:hypothetical protein